MNLQSTINALVSLRPFLSILFDERCRLCDDPLHQHGHHLHQKILCPSCYDTLPSLSRHARRCFRCAIPLGENLSDINVYNRLQESTVIAPDSLCGQCQLGAMADIHSTVAAFEYLNPIDHLIINIKHQPDAGLINFFAQAIINNTPDYWHKGINAVEGIIPMPLHPSRLAQRGFNQSLLLAKALGRVWGIPVYPDLALRTQDTGTQANHNRDERLKRLKGAMKVPSEKVLYIKGKRLLIVDDVMTTGASMMTLAQALKQAGAGVIEACVACRVGRHHGDRLV